MHVHGRKIQNKKQLQTEIRTSMKSKTYIYSDLSDTTIFDMNC